MRPASTQPFFPLTRTCVVAVALALSGAVGTAAAADTALEKSRGEARERYRAEKRECAKLRGEAEDVCEKEARLRRVRAEAEAELRVDGSARNRLAMAYRVADAEHDLAEEKCDALEGKAEDDCEAAADRAHEAARRAARARHAPRAAR